MTPRRRIIPMFIPHHGCAHDCVFCDQRLISGMAGDVSREDVRKAYAGYLAENSDREGCNPEPTFRPAEIAFYGGSFTALPAYRQKELLEAARPFLDLNPLNSIRVSTRPDCVDGSTALRLKGYGVATIELGAQSMCDSVLEQTRRGHTAADVRNAAAAVKSAGLALILQMMTGLPGDSREKSIYTAEQLAKLDPDGVRIYPTVVVRGTHLHEMWLRGDYKEHTVDDAVELCSELCKVFDEAGVPVIRLGLNPSAALSTGGAAAGAYHPALGELVLSKVYYDKAAALLGSVKPDSDVTIAVAKGCVSMMAGHNRRNIHALAQEFSLRSVKVIEAEIDKKTIKII